MSAEKPEIDTLSGAMIVVDKNNPKGSGIVPAGKPMRGAYRLVSSVDLTNLLYEVGSRSPQNGEVATAIGDAANDDPLFPARADGAEWTAALLTAIGIKASGLHTSLISIDKGAYGLFQIRVPKGYKVMANDLLLPKTAAYFAIDLVRQSILRSASRPVYERLQWFVDPNGELPVQDSFRKGMEYMAFAEDLRRRLVSR